MKFLKAIIAFFWTKHEVTPVSESITDAVVQATTQAATTTTTAAADTSESLVAKVEYDLDEVLAKLKDVLIAGGHDIEASYDKAVAYVKSVL